MKIYVGNISHSTTEDELRAAFTPFGNVDSCRLATDKMSGKPKGFGFLEMNNDTEAKAAIAGLDGKDLGGRTLKVNVSEPKPQTGGAGGGGRWLSESPALSLTGPDNMESTGRRQLRPFL